MSEELRNYSASKDSACCIIGLHVSAIFNNIFVEFTWTIEFPKTARLVLDDPFAFTVFLRTPFSFSSYKYILALSS